MIGGEVWRWGEFVAKGKSNLRSGPLRSAIRGTLVVIVTVFFHFMLSFFFTLNINRRSFFFKLLQIKV